MIPEYVPVTTSVTTTRPGTYDNPLGHFLFRHVQISWFRGYRQTDLGNDQQAFVAAPEKALLDLLYLEPDGDKEAYLRSLRLQNMKQLDSGRLRQLAADTRKPKLNRAVKMIIRLVEEEKRVPVPDQGQ